MSLNHSKAVLLGHAGVICILLERGLNINCTLSDGETMLYCAARIGSGLLACILVNKGININSKSSDDETALHTAARCGQDHIVLFLVKCGIDIAYDLNEYAPFEDEDSEEIGGPIVYFQDCRPTIFTELEDRQKRAVFESFIHRHIEYLPYIIILSTSKLNLIGWKRAAALMTLTRYFSTCICM